MHTDTSFGIIPVHVQDGRRRYLLVQHCAGHWGFPKGHPEADETPRQTAVRELAEETGVTDVQVLDEPTWMETYIFTKRSGRKVRKTVTYFLGRVGDETVTPQPDEVQACAWGDAEETRRRLDFPEARRLLEQAEAHLAEAAGERFP